MLAKHLSKCGIKARNLTAKGKNAALNDLSAGTLQVLCITDSLKLETRLPPIDFVFHVCVPSSLSTYAEETLWTALRSPSLCVLFYRFQDTKETQKKLGLNDFPLKLRGGGKERKGEKELRQVIRYCSNGGLCRFKILAESIEDDQRASKCGGVTCCDNCRARYGQEGSPMAITANHRAVSLTAESDGGRPIKLCRLDITKYLVDLFKLAKLDRRENISRAKLRKFCQNSWKEIDRPLPGDKVSLRQWRRISPLQSLSDNAFIRNSFIHLLMSQGVFGDFRREAGSLDKRAAKSLLSGLEKGTVKFYIRNFRAFRVPATAYPPQNGDLSNAAKSLSPKSASKSSTGASKNEEMATATSSANSQEAPVVDSPSINVGTVPQISAMSDVTMTDALEDETRNDYPSDFINSSRSRRLLNIDERSMVSTMIESVMRDEDLHVQQDALNDDADAPDDEMIEEKKGPERERAKEELRLIRNGFNDFPRLEVPLRSVSWIRRLPHLIQYELWRLMNSDSKRRLSRDQLEQRVKGYVDSAQMLSSNLFDACKFIHSLTKTEDSMRQYGDIIRESSNECDFSTSHLLFSALLRSDGCDCVTLLPPKMAKSRRVFKKFGFHRFFHVLVPEHIPNANLIKILEGEKPIHIAGKNYKFLWANMATSPHDLFLFAESGVGIAANEEKTVHQVREWCVPVQMNQSLITERSHMALGLCLVPSASSGTLPANSLHFDEDSPSLSATSFKFNGGCGRVSKAAMDLIWTSFCNSRSDSIRLSQHLNSSTESSSDSSDEEGERGCPHSSFEGAIGGMRGVWVLDPTLGQGVKVICRRSQKLFDLPMASLVDSSLSEAYNVESCQFDLLYDCVEVFHWDEQPSEGCLNQRLVQILEHCGVGADIFKKYVDDGMKRLLRLGRSASDTQIKLVRQEAEAMRDQASYPVKRSKILRLLPDHTNLIAEGEAYIASASDRDNRQIERSGLCLVAPTSIYFENELLSLKVVSLDTLRTRALEGSAAAYKDSYIDPCQFFRSLKTGIVMCRKGPDPTEPCGGEFFGKVWVSWDDKLVSQVEQRESKRVVEAVTFTSPPRGRYLTQVRLQNKRLLFMENMLSIVNDLKGVGHTESKVVAACAYALAKYPNHIQDVSSRPEIHTDKLKKYPHWLAKSKVPKSSASGDRSIRSYKSKRSLGALWNYMEYKLGLGFGI